MTAAIALAEQHDRAGRHDDAINALARATQGGDIDAMTALGQRLLIGDRAPLLPTEATGMLLDAAKAGSAEAALRLAVLKALGAHMPQDWNDAIGLLVFAAEHGSDSARKQLTALAGEPLAAAADTTGWRQLANRIDAGFWQHAPAGTTLSANPLVRVFPEFVTDPICAWLIERARPKLQRALIYDPVNGKDIADHMRTNSAAGFDLIQADVVQVAIQSRMSVATGIPLHHMEGATVLHYSPGEEITNHYDFVNPKIPNYEKELRERGQRVATFLVYLNDDYEGGETDFPQLALRYHGGKRAGLVFGNALADGQPDLRMVHAGLPPRDGEKWLMTQFIRNRPVLNARSENYG
ncbi:MAG TPA: 2OG-Fe(II) oxygenase [Gammaproteobacteria bacterium]|nr:2OG-Fe(II) oxygenase [Gammaproteobacteria bacterium]